MIIEVNQASISRVIFVTVMESGLDHENLLWYATLVSGVAELIICQVCYCEYLLVPLCLPGVFYLQLAQLL